MYVCYVDESGCTGSLPSATSPVQPMFVIAAVAVPQPRLAELTHDLLNWKLKYFPRLCSQHRFRFDVLLTEVKGADVRRSVTAPGRNERRHAIGLLDHFLRLLEAHRARIFGRIWIKVPGQPLAGTSVYTSSIQAICRTFQELLRREDSSGIVIADSRTKAQNTRVSHSIFTQKFQAGGDPYDRILEMPTFGHSDNHVGIQAADLLCSALLWPMAIDAYCGSIPGNVHVKPGYGVLRQRFGPRIKALQFQYADLANKRAGGLIVSDPLGQQSTAHLFRSPSSSPPSVAIAPGTSVAVPTPTLPLSTPNVSSGATPS